MIKSEIRWPPQVGDHVQIVATGAPVVVIGGSAARHYLVGIYSREMRMVTTAPYRTFMLRELGPESAPQAAVAPAPAGTGRRARQPAAAEQRPTP